MLLGGLLGAILGSFIGALCLRWPRGVSVVGGRSHCDGCGKILTAWELIPLISFVIQRGRCRTCGALVDKTQLAAELAGGAIGIGAFGFLPLVTGAVLAIMSWILLPLILLDYRHYWLPDRLIISLAAAGPICGLLLRSDYNLMVQLLAAAAGFAAFELLRRGFRLTRGKDGMGAGDPKLFGALALWLPPLSLPYLLLGASMLGLLLFSIRNKKADGSEQRIPLGSCLGITAILIFFVNQRDVGF